MDKDYPHKVGEKNYFFLGILRMVAALTLRFPQWGWALLDGAATTLLGLLVYLLFPENPASVMWIIGVLDRALEFL